MKVVSPYEELKIWFSLESYEQLKCKRRLSTVWSRIQDPVT